MTPYYRTPMPSTAPLWCFLVAVLAVVFVAGMATEAGIRYMRQEIAREAERGLKRTSPRVTQPRFNCKDVPEMREACRVQARLEKVKA